MRSIFSFTLNRTVKHNSMIAHIPIWHVPCVMQIMNLTFWLILYVTFTNTEKTKF